MRTLWTASSLTSRNIGLHRSRGSPLELATKPIISPVGVMSRNARARSTELIRNNYEPLKVGQASACLVLIFASPRNTSKEDRLKPVLHRPNCLCTEQFGMQAKQVMVRHPRDIVADHAILGAAFCKFGVGLGHGFRVFHVKLENLGESFHGTLAIDDDGRLAVQPRN